MAFTPGERAVYDEARKLLPGLLACKQRKDVDGSRALVHGMIEIANAAGISPCQMWAMAFNAALHWYMQAAHAVSTARDVSFDEVIEEMSMAAAVWAARDSV